MDVQLSAQIASYQADGDFLKCQEMTDLMDKVRVGLLITTLAGIGIAGFGATGRLRSTRMKTPGEDLRATEMTFCRYCGMPDNMSGYCAGCGQGRQISSSLFRRCVHCGGNASDDSSFCTSCGWKF